jgi:hypothetical protein
MALANAPSTTVIGPSGDMKRTPSAVVMVVAHAGRETILLVGG